MALKPGDPAPAFSAKDTEGNTRSLADYRGKKLILYFYPKDDTPGCTKEACSLRDHRADLEAKNAEVLGVSTDSVASHQKFSQKFGLNFPLLADTDKSVAKAYEAIGGLVGLLGIAKRITYVIDEEGKILHVIDAVKTGKAGPQVLELI